MRPAVSIGGPEGSATLSEPIFDSSCSIYSASSDNFPPRLSDDDLNRLFDRDPSHEPDLSFLEGGLPIDLLAGGDLSAFTFDSMVDLDPEPVDLDGLESAISFPDSASHQASGVQPSFGASASRCDEQGIAASNS